jgi:uncharacterized Zn finger protein (UPF0148 family)
MSNEITFTVELVPDEKGYIDRQCHNSKCEFIFKVFVNDWREKVSDNEVYCPMCRYMNAASEWNTKEQERDINHYIEDYAFNYMSNEFDKVLQQFAKSINKSNKALKIEVRSNKTRRLNNRIEQRPEWELDITCEKCATRFSIIGSAYFCPCCGYNAVDRVIEDSLDRIETMIKSESILYDTYKQVHGVNMAETITKSLIESSLGDLISAFQAYAESIYKKIEPDSKVRANDFQRVDSGSELFYNSAGKGYDSWLSTAELNDMKLLFQQRHILEHKNGIIDERYLLQSGDNNYIPGQRIIVKKTDVNRLLDYIRKLTKGLKSLVKG